MKKINLKTFYFFILTIFFFSTFCSPVKAIGPGEIEYQYSNPLEDTDTSTEITSFTDLIKKLLGSLQSIIGWLAIIFICIGAFFYMTAAGDPNRLATGKNIITSALIGFAIVVGAPSIMKEISNIGGGTSTSSNLINNSKDIKVIAGDVLNFILTITGILAVIAFIISGFLYLSSSGNSSQQEKAKKALLFSVIGVFVASSGIIIIKQITVILNG